METIFEKILKGEIRSNKVYENEFALAFYDISPKAPVHVLVIPKRKMVSFADVRTVEDHKYLAEYFKAISQAAAHLGLEDDGYRVVFNAGKNGGQEVPYLHAHILAGRQMTWPPG